MCEGQFDSDQDAIQEFEGITVGNVRFERVGDHVMIYGKVGYGKTVIRDPIDFRHMTYALENAHECICSRHAWHPDCPAHPRNYNTGR